MDAHLPDAELIQRFNQKSVDHPQIYAVLQQKSSAASAVFYEEGKQGLSLLELMGLTTFAAIGLAAIVNLGVLGAFICFAIAVLWSVAIRVVGMHPGKIRFLTQLIWGIIMPLFCLLADPYFFAIMKNGRPLEFSQGIAMPAYLCHAFLFALLAISVFLKPKTFAFVHSYVAGGLMGFGLIFLLLGFFLIPAILIGALALVGLLGLSPWITGIVLIKSSAMHSRWAGKGNRWNRWFFWLLGFITPIALWIGLVSAAASGTFDPWYEALLQSR